MKLLGLLIRVWCMATVLVLSDNTIAQPSNNPSTTAVAKAPTLVHGPQPFPADALLAGHNGTVLVSVTLNESGLIENPSIRKSSGSSILDNAALDAAKGWKLTPALDASGVAVRTQITLSLEYTKAFDTNYKCEQFIIDSDWFDAAKGRGHREELRIYKTLRGFPIMAAIRSGQTQSLKGYDFDIKWDQLIDYCRKNQKKNFRESWQKLL